MFFVKGSSINDVWERLKDYVMPALLNYHYQKVTRGTEKYSIMRGVIYGRLNRYSLLFKTAMFNSIFPFSKNVANKTCHSPYLQLNFDTD